MYSTTKLTPQNKPQKEDIIEFLKDYNEKRDFPTKLDPYRLMRFRRFLRESEDMNIVKADLDAINLLIDEEWERMTNDQQ